MQKDTLVDTQNWFLKAVPNPTTKNVSTQFGCHLEEILEMVDVLKGEDYFSQMVLIDLRHALKTVSEHMKSNSGAIYVNQEDREELLDSLADQIVTATGVGVFLGMNVPGALDEVNRSNYSKFENGEPVFNENKKVMKGKDYTPPDLSKFI